MTLPDGHWIGSDSRALLSGDSPAGPGVPVAHAVFFQLLQHGRIPHADSERIVIRVAWRMGFQYEFAHHTRMALELGVYASGGADRAMRR
jgi:hypothetical protein